MSRKLMWSVLLMVTIFPVTASAVPINYVLTGVFDTVNFPEPGAIGPLDQREFTIEWTVPDAANPTDPFGTSYFVDASLAIDGVGSFDQTVVWSLNPFVISYGRGPFTNILTTGDSLFFGICGGGACNDPNLYNRDPFNPVLFTGTFPLGLDSSCAFDAPCLNAQTNYFGETFFGTRYFGTLIVTASDVPEPATILLLGAGVTGLIARRQRRRTLHK